jgi:HlyD family secretion protein
LSSDMPTEGEEVLEAGGVVSSTGSAGLAPDSPAVATSEQPGPRENPAARTAHPGPRPGAEDTGIQCDSSANAGANAGATAKPSDLAPGPRLDAAAGDKARPANAGLTHVARRSSLKIRASVMLVIIIGAGVAAVLVKPIRFLRAAVSTSVEEITLSPRPFSIDINCSGSLRATSVQNFGGPPGFGDYWQFQIVSLVPDGRNVKKGDVLITFDSQKLNQDLQQYQSELDQANKELEKTKVQIDLEGQDLAAKLAEAENRHATLQLKQSAIPALEKSIKIEEDKLAVEEARQEVESIKEWIDWHKKSNDATYKIIESKKARAELKVADIKRAMDRFQAKADRDGVAVYKVKWNGERYQVGENVWTGSSVIEIPDLNTIIAECFVPEVDIGKVHTGQRVDVTIDAVAGKSYSGRVTGIGRLVHQKAWDVANRILESQITLDHLDTSIMRPAMSVKVKIETESLSDAIVVPLGAVLRTSEGWLVRVRSDGGWRDRPVQLGASNSTDVVITDGVKSGEKIAPDYQKAGPAG